MMSDLHFLHDDEDRTAAQYLFNALKNQYNLECISKQDV